MLNFGVNIYEDGHVLSVVTDTGSHGTHVAGIVAGHHTDHPTGELDGVAPGAQIVSLKIGDARLDGMETTQTIERAAIAIMQNRVDVINMSYDEKRERERERERYSL